MTEELKKTIEEELKVLPKYIQDIIFNSTWETDVENIGTEHGLDQEEINELQAQTIVCLAGFEDLRYLAQNIENNVGTSPNEASKIKNSLVEKVFSPIMEKALEETKKRTGDNDFDWKKNIDFVFSDGDYSTLIEEKKTNENNSNNDLINKVKIQLQEEK